MIQLNPTINPFELDTPRVEIHFKIALKFNTIFCINL